MKIRNFLSLATLTVAVIGFAIFCLGRFGVQKVRAFNPQPDPPGFGMLGVTGGQTIRINIVNTAHPEPGTPPDPCHATMSLLDANGNVIIRPNGTPARKTVELNPGEAAVLVLNADNFTREADNRLQLRPEIRLQQATGNGGTPPDPCYPNAEVINNVNGKTELLINAVPVTRAVLVTDIPS